MLNLDNINEYINFLKSIDEPYDNVYIDIFDKWEEILQLSDIPDELIDDISLIYSNALDIISNKLDYRCDQYENNLETLKRALNYISCTSIPQFLIFPFKVVASLFTNRELLGEQENNCIDTLSDDSITEKDLFDFAYVLYWCGLGNDKSIRTITSNGMANSMSTFYKLMDIEGREDVMSFKHNEYIPENSIDIVNAYIPNENKLLSLYNRMLVQNDIKATDILDCIDILNITNDELLNGGYCNIEYIRSKIVDYFRYYHNALQCVFYNKNNDINIESYLSQLADNLIKEYKSCNHHVITGTVMRVLLCVLWYYKSKSDNVDKKILEANMVKLANVIYPRNGESNDTLSIFFICDKLEGFTIATEASNAESTNNTSSDVFIDSNENFNGLSYSSSIPITRVSELQKEGISLMRALTESFEVLRDGTIKVSIPKNSSYMNEYATNHRLLKYHHKMRNYNGMKYNLVYHMILIDSVERDVIYPSNKRKSIPNDVYEDAVKARDFAKNDIGTYLPIIAKVDKDFDLNTFYKEVKADRETITIDGVATISGLKKIFNSILY